MGSVTPIKPEYIDHYKVVRNIDVYSYISHDGISVRLAIVEDTDNKAIMIRITDKRFTDEPLIYGTHFYCDDLSEEKQEWLANIVGAAMLATLVGSTKNLRLEMQDRFKSFTKLMGL